MRTAVAQEKLEIEAIVSLLDDEHDTKVRELWAALEREFGLQGIYATPFPHFSYHGAKRYDDRQIRLLLEQVARATSPFQIRTTGLGIFTGPMPVLYLPVVRSPALTECHQKLWPSFSSFASNANLHYHPDRWLPHVTLAYGDLTHELIPEVVRFLAGRDFSWEVGIDNLSLVYAKEQEQGIAYRLELNHEDAA